MPDKRSWHSGHGHGSRRPDRREDHGGDSEYTYEYLEDEESEQEDEPRQVRPAPPAASAAPERKQRMDGSHRPPTPPREARKAEVPRTVPREPPPPPPKERKEKKEKKKKADSKKEHKSEKDKKGRRGDPHDRRSRSTGRRPAEERSTRRSRSPVELRRAPGHNPYPEDMPSMNTGSSGSGNAGVSGALPTPVSPTHGPPDLGSALGPGDWVWVSSPGYWVFVPHEVPHQKGRHQSPGWESEKGRHKGKRPESPKGSPKGPPKGPPRGKAKIPPKEKNPKGRGRRAKARVTRGAKTGLANTKDEGKPKQQHRPEPREARADGAADPTAVVVTMMVRPPLKRKVTAVMPETSPARGNMAQAVGMVMSPVTMRTTTKAIMREGLRVRP